MLTLAPTSCAHAVTPIGSIRRLAPILVVGCLCWCFASSARAELITVGPTASGCDFDNLVFAIVRAAITPEADTIAIASNLTYTNTVGLKLANEAAVTMKGVLSCSSELPFRRRITTTRGPLIDFDNTDLTLDTLELVSNDQGTRLVQARGPMRLILDDTRLISGSSLTGGNMHIVGGVSLEAIGTSQIVGGYASAHGGGIYCVGSSIALGSSTRVSGNHADSQGGGIYGTSCVMTLLGGGTGPGNARYGVFQNSALREGGGVFATNDSDVVIAGTAAGAAEIADNSALQGGGVAISGSTTTAVIQNAAITGNTATGRAAALSITDGAGLTMHRTVPSCNRGVRCSLIAGNLLNGSASPDRTGGAIAVERGGRAEIRQTYFTANFDADDGTIALVDGGGSFLLLEGVSLVFNEASGRQVLARNGGLARLAFVSAWGTSSTGIGTALLGAESNGRAELFSSIVIEGNGVSTTGFGSDRVFAPAGVGATYTADCVIAHEVASLPDPFSSHRLETDPTRIWANQGAGEPELARTSPAIDFCDDAVYSPVDDDIDGQARGVDTLIPDGRGIFDVGADEFQEPDGLIFWDDFESNSTGAWDLIFGS